MIWTTCAPMADATTKRRVDADVATGGARHLAVALSPPSEGRGAQPSPLDIRVQLVASRMPPVAAGTPNSDHSRRRGISPMP
jgi:hypothetical protein